MSREKFAALLEKYQEGRCSDQEKQLVEYWFALLETNATQDTSEPELTSAEDRIWSRMQEAAPNDFAESRPSIPLRNIFIQWIGIAASLLLVGWVVLGDRFGKIFHTGTHSEYAWVEKNNEGVTNILITLEDSSTVELEPRSSLRYPEHFDNSQRIVELKGKGFFEIRKNPQKPFYVHSGKMVTRVLGTSFYVQNEPNKHQTKVEVVTGLVSVYRAIENSRKPVKPVRLTPNHSATFDATLETFTVGLADRPRLVNESVPFQFQNAPLSKVVENMTAAWGVEIQTDNQQMLNCPLTADLSGQPLFIQLDIICAALNARYKTTGTTIRISGAGCREAKTRSSINAKPIHPDM
ncbi:MAG: FecR domain-containing protein [Dyadobacter sp.]|uniref:FecR family protein n=1 Tax=Dyadobacter sp. TaxID=1914288 RepID=UPI0032676CB5